MSEIARRGWLASLPEAEATALLAVARPLRLAPGEAAFRQGQPVVAGALAFFGLQSGALKVSILHPSGKEAVLVLVEPGNWVGEVSLLDGLPRSNTAVAIEPAELLAVTTEHFAALMQRPGFAAGVARLEAGRLRLAYGAMADAALHTTRERVARRLSLLAHGDVSLAEGGRRQVETSQDMLAMMLGISRPTLSKELQVLAELGALALRYGRIEILDHDLLLREGLESKT